MKTFKLGKSKEDQQKLDAASCYLTHCEAQYAIGSPQYIQAKSLYDQGVNLTNEQTLLKGTGAFAYTTQDNLSNGKFITTTSLSDQSKDANARTQQTQNIAYANQQNEAIADGAALVSKTAGQWSAASTSYATYLNTVPTAPSKAAATVMYGQALLATEVGLGASMVEQMVRPNVGKGVTDLTIDVGSKWVSDKNLIFSYPINETAEQLKNSNTVQTLQQKFNDGYINLINQVSKGGQTK